MKCQHCDGLQMDYINYKGTHIHTCPECPNVSFDLVYPDDLDNLTEFLKEEMK